jgi:signal transduction histidine kinase
VIGEQIARMRAVMQGFLALARGDAPARSSVSSARLAAEAADLVRHRFDGAGVELRAEIEASSTVRCDPALIVQALANVLVNACQASTRGQTVTLRARDDLAAGRVRFVVEDEGAGMDDEEMARATAPFFTTRSREGGTGLGLAIAAEITQHHGGTVTLSRGAPRGLRATIDLPVEPAAKEVAA